MSRHRWIEWAGNRRLLCEWAALTGVKPSTLRSRLDRGMPLEQAMALPTLNRQQCGQMSRPRTSWR